MELKHYKDFTNTDHEAIRYLRTQINGTHLRDVTLMYNYQDHPDRREYNGVISPFVSEPSSMMLALLCGYLTEYRCGGVVSKDRTGGFKVVLYKEA